MIERLTWTLNQAGLFGFAINLGPPITISYLSEYTQAQINAGNAILAGFDFSQAAEDAWLLDRIHEASLGIYDNSDDLGRINRAIVVVLLAEINNLRQWIASFKAATAAATTFANLQTRVAALANTPDRTAAQARTALTSAVNANS